METRIIDTRLPLSRKIGMLEMKIHVDRRTIARREEIISRRNREQSELSAGTEYLIRSTNALRRELIEAEAELRTLKNIK